MKDRFTQFSNDLILFLADLKNLFNRQTAHAAFTGYWEEINRDSYRKIPLILTVAVHLFALLISLLAPFVITQTSKIPEVYTVDLYQVMEAESPSPQNGKSIKAPKPAAVAEPVKPDVIPPEPDQPKPVLTKRQMAKERQRQQEDLLSQVKKPVAVDKQIKPDAVSLSPIREKLAREKKEKEYRKKQADLLNQKMKLMRLELERKKAEQEARDAAAAAANEIAEMYRRTFNLNTVVRESSQRASDSGETGRRDIDPLVLQAMQKYKARLFAHISPHWQLPELQNWDENLRAVIVLKVKRDGTVTSTNFEKRSKNLRFNQYVQKAIDNAQPLPPFPLDLRQKSEEIAVTFSPGGLM